MSVLNRFFCSSTARSGRRVGSSSGMKTPSAKKSLHIQTMPPQEFLLEERQIALHGVVIFPQRHKGGIAGRKGGFDALEKFSLPILVDAQAAENFINGQVRQQVFGNHASPFSASSKGFLGEAFQGAEQTGGELVDAQHDRLRLVMGDGPQQAALFCERNDLGDIGQDLLSAFGACIRHAPGGGTVAQLRDGSADEIGDDVNANHILFTAIQDVAEIIGQLCQETLVEGFVRPDRQALQFLDAAALGAQAALGNGFRRPGSDRCDARAAIRAHDIAG